MQLWTLQLSKEAFAYLSTTKNGSDRYVHLNQTKVCVRLNWPVTRVVLSLAQDCWLTLSTCHIYLFYLSNEEA